MLITSFEPLEISAPAIKYRGCDSYFWKRKRFQDLPVYTTEIGAVKREFDFIMIFDPRQFLAIGSEGVAEIVKDLSSRDPEKDVIVTTEGKPYFIISYAGFKKLNLNPFKDKDLISKLRNNGNARMITLRNSYYIFDTFKDVVSVETIVTSYQVEMLLTMGVIIDNFSGFYMEGIIPIGEGTRISTGVTILGDTRIGKNVRLYPNCFIENSIIEDNCIVLPGCVIRNATLEANVQVGPYTHLREGSIVKDGAKMGNFVEMKKSTLGKGSKAMHLSYIGDAEIGEGVNVGAGTITCNYDGKNKNKTVIEDNVFIGSGTELVAPITIRKNSYIGAGSTITTEVPEDSLAVAREKQRNIVGWVNRKKKKQTCDL